MRSLRIATMLWMGMVAFCVSTVFAQSYPNKVIRVVTNEAGGDSDLQIRLLVANGLPELLGQPVVVENRPTVIVGELVARAAPDGYTLIVFGGSLWNAPFLSKTAYDPVKDFTPITILTSTPQLLVVNSSVPVNSVKDLVALAKAKPGFLNFPNTGPGATSNLSAELFKYMAGVNLVGVRYKGTPQAINALISGEVQVGFLLLANALPQVKTGKLKALAVTSPQPSALFPELPTVASAGLPGFAAGALSAFLAPAKTPTAIVNRLNQETVRVLNKPEVKDRHLAAGVEVVGSSPKESAALIAADMATIGKLIKDVGIKAE
jgi:tripartite-type tricarboxylate transporter receptor subunit TctC